MVVQLSTYISPNVFKLFHRLVFCPTAFALANACLFMLLVCNTTTLSKMNIFYYYYWLFTKPANTS